jgi:2-dehydropantoate 2-reductase
MYRSASEKHHEVAVSARKFVVLGAGSIGSIIGAHLARAGHAVAMLARGHRAQQILTDGLRIRGLAQFDMPVEVLTDPSQLHSAETLILATKALNTQAALEPLRGAKIETAFSIQNGIMKNELLANAFGRDRVLGSLANTSGELLPSGEVLFTRNVNLLIGELPGGPSERAQRIVDALEASGVRSSQAPDIVVQEWSKFVGWVGLVVAACTTRASTWKYLSDPGAALVLVRLAREVGALAARSGVELTDDSMMPVATLCRTSEDEAVNIVLKIGNHYRANAPQHRMSTLQDLEAGRPLEVEETLGFAARKAVELGLSLPLLAAAYELLGAIDRTRQ